MNSLVILICSVAILVLGYRFYSRFVARRLDLGRLQKTPAHTLRDGVDYVPARKSILLGHHFASIAGAAPIIGPIIAVQFGWLPVLIWILVGSVLIGAVHDFTALVASVRHEGRSIGTLIEKYLGRLGKILFLLFAWATLILVIAVFTLVVAGTFVKTPAVATASVLFIFVAVAFGLSVYRLRVNFVAASVVGVLLLLLCLYVGVKFPFPSLFSGIEGPDRMIIFWQAVLLCYVFVASVTPVNILLQPRDYLNSFLLYGILILSVVAIVVAPPMIRGEAFVGTDVPNLGPLFPILFVTVACGAVSGFHALVASGTTAKQLDKERDARAVGYGAMLIESGLAVLALLTAAVLTKQEYMSALITDGKANPVHVFSVGVANFLAALGIHESVGVGFAGLTVSAFALTSLDTATRLARFSMQELATKSDRTASAQSLMARNRYLATGITVAVSAALIFSGKTMGIWKIFGAANQLLAALALMAITVWLASRKTRSLFVFIPMVLMYAVAVSALLLLFVEGVSADAPNLPLLILVVALFVLAGLLAYNYIRVRWREVPGS